MTSLCHVASLRIKVFFKNINMRYLIVSKEEKKKYMICVRMGKKNPSLAVEVCHHQSESLVMPNDDPWNVVFYPILTLMIDLIIEP